MAIKRGINKKAISEIVGYVLLISISIALGSMIYMWLKGYVAKPLPEEACPDGVNLIIFDYACYLNGTQKTINLTIQNRGLFNVDAYIIKINNASSSEKTGDIVGRYPLNDIAAKTNIIVFKPALTPSNSTMNQFDYTGHNKLRQIEILPKKITEKGSSICSKAIIQQEIKCD